MSRPNIWRTRKKADRARQERDGIARMHDIQNIRSRLIRASGGKCSLCGCQVTLDGGPKTATVDHILPLSHGGTDAPGNLRLACFTCNNQRGNALDEPEAPHD